MIIRNGNVFQEDGTYRRMDLYVENGRIVDCGTVVSDKEEIDAAGLKVLPGLVDIHSHGAVGHDFSDADATGLKEILRYEKSQGITSYCPTSMTLPIDMLIRIFASADAVKPDADCARIVGLNMEGPFLDPVKKGAHVEKYIRKLRITPTWDIRLEFVEDPAWPKTGDIKIDCADRKAIILLNIANPKREENFEEIIVHELMHIKMYPLDQVTESLIVNCFEEGSAASNFAYEQFFTTLEQTVEELAKCFLLEFGENKELSYGRCRQEKSFNDLYDGLKNID